MHRTEQMEVWNSQGRYPQERENTSAFDFHASRMAQETHAKAGRNRRSRVIWILLGLLFLKFAAVLVLTGFLFTSYSKLNQQVLQISSKSCENEWLEYGKHCYFFSTFQLNWKKAENMCLNRGGHLVIINNREEQDFLERNRKDRMLWIGLTDLDTENTFKWIDGTTLTFTSFTNWLDGEPNDEFQDEDCVEMWLSGKWNDENCNATQYAICEKPLY